jgi:hypothetical protein
MRKEFLPQFLKIAGLLGATSILLGACAPGQASASNSEPNHWKSPGGTIFEFKPGTNSEKYDLAEKSTLDNILGPLCQNETGDPNDHIEVIFTPQNNVCKSPNSKNDPWGCVEQKNDNNIIIYIYDQYIFSQALDPYLLLTGTIYHEFDHACDLKKSEDQVNQEETAFETSVCRFAKAKNPISLIINPPQISSASSN